MTVAPSPAVNDDARTGAGRRAPARLLAAELDGPLLLARAADVAAQSRPSPKTRQDYTRIYDRLVRWLAGRLGRAPSVEDLTAEELLAWRNHRERVGGPHGHGLAPASVRVEVAAVRVLLRQLGLHDVAAALAVAQHPPAPPQTISVEEYGRLLRMPDRRTRIGLRDRAILQVLADTGLRSAELRTLQVRHLERARTDSPHRRLRVLRGKGGRSRLVPLTPGADSALEEWLARHPAARGVGSGRRSPPEDAPLFCTLGRGGRDPGRPLSAAALRGLVAQHTKAAGIAAHLRHPHVLRAFWVTRHADLGTPLHRLMKLGGWQSLRTLQAYLHVQDADLQADVDRFAAADAARDRERRAR